MRNRGSASRALSALRVSPAAHAQVSDYARHYAGLRRPDAIRNLRAILVIAGERIETRRGLFFPAPRRFPDLARPGWAWLKVCSFWMAFSPGDDGTVIQAMFHETPDILKKPESMSALL